MFKSSHLSDAQELLDIDNVAANKRINFAKWLIGTVRDMNQIIDPDEKYKEFIAKFPLFEY